MPENSTDLVANPYSWNKNANVLYLDHPAGVGFSTCNGTDCDHSDASDGIDNLSVMRSFFAAFPEYKKHDLWLSGESYAGIYIPYLLWNIDQFNTNSSTSEEDKINVKGMMVGDGVTNWAYDTMPATLNMTY